MKIVTMSVLSLIFLMILSVQAIAQTAQDDVVYLKNGGVIRGVIIEQTPGKSLKIQTKDGNIFVYVFDDITKITKEENTAGKSTKRASAQTTKAYKFFASGELGFAISPEDFTDYYTKGFGFGVGVEYEVSPNWALVGLFDMKFLGPNGGMIADWWDDEGEYPRSTNIEVSEGKLTAGTIAILGKGCLKSPGSQFFPYIKGGFGITIAGADQIKVSFINAGGSPQTEWVAGVGSETNISIILGFGAEKMLGKGNSSLFIDAGLHMIMQSDVNPTIAPITIGVKF